jgi:uncharacterized membrane protein YdbT with pleckstrin-like domain
MSTLTGWQRIVVVLMFFESIVLLPVSLTIVAAGFGLVYYYHTNGTFSWDALIFLVPFISYVLTAILAYITSRVLRYICEGFAE